MRESAICAAGEGDGMGRTMNMFTSSELATTTRKVCDSARTQGCAIITTNGKADLAMIDLSGFASINDFVHMLDRWRSESALQRLRAHAAESEMTFEEIEAEISAARESAAHAFSKTEGADRAGETR